MMGKPGKSEVKYNDSYSPVLDCRLYGNGNDLKTEQYQHCYDNHLGSTHPGKDGGSGTKGVPKKAKASSSHQVTPGDEVEKEEVHHLTEKNMMRHFKTSSRECPSVCN